MCMGCSRLRVERKRIVARHSYKGLTGRAYENAMTDLDHQWNALPCRLVDQDYWINSVGNISRSFTPIDPSDKSPLVADFSIKAAIANYQDSFNFRPFRPVTATDIMAARVVLFKFDYASFVDAWRKDFLSTVDGGFVVCFNQVTNSSLLVKEKCVPLGAGDKFGEFEGHRAWLYDLRSGLLKSCWQNQYVWHPAAVFSANEEVDDFGPHGIHGFKSKNEIERYASVFQSDVVVFGRVRLWGDVIEHDRGYRAEFARIVGLDRIRFPRGVRADCDRANRVDHLAALRRLYNVEEPNGD